MKDPSDDHYGIDADRSCRSACIYDHEDWPCKTVRKWRRSKGFQIVELRKICDALIVSNAALNERLTKLEGIL
ncbi:hypothetical protein [Streptomyces sp. SID3212]|uniref:hypothetical protein n=1 Tax=Streptomyces sp. SID3212 TaxID=2690259 RepID=UPI00136915FC|nr:hypothetical protein [Streptomyces sp. SID3212]MYV58020.1 hypothetical protein [Streptomyces sp. SID3212]